MDDKKTPKKKLNPIKVFIDLFPVIYGASPLLWTIVVILGIFHGTAWGFQTLVQQRFFDSAAALTSGDTKINTVFLMLAALGGIHILAQVLNGVCNFMPDVIAGKISGKLSLGIHEKLGRISPVLFEDTERLDDINKANAGKDNAIWFVFIGVTIFTFYLPYFLFMGWYLFTLKPILALGIAIVFVPTALTQIMRAKVFAKLEDKSAPLRRENGYYESAVVSREYFKETRLTGGYDFFYRLWKDTLYTINKMSFSASVRSSLCETAMKIVTAGGYIAILLMLFSALMNGEISVGAFAAVYSSIGLLYGIMEEVICRHLSSMAQNLGTVSNYLAFRGMAERDAVIDADMKNYKLPEKYDIALEGASFRYPGAESDALSDVTLTLHSGETLAVVGENGSGKSTLVRLLLGLYAPSAGGALIRGCDGVEREMSKIPFRELVSRQTAVFQKYQRYKMTLSENISISNTKTAADKAALDAACEISGVDSSSLPYTDGYDTMLTREFDGEGEKTGIDLSGGQWQRAAIARGMFRAHDIIALDEPTAAIDPCEETRIYNTFARVTRDKTAIIVTHRLGSVKNADRIAVMHKGRLEELGTHDELIAAGGIYKKLWLSQAENYVDDMANVQ